MIDFLFVYLYHSHTHTFNGPLSGTTRVSLYQKGKTNLDFSEARDNECQWHPLGHMQVCTSLQWDNHASTPPLEFFIGQMPFLPPNQQRQSTEGRSCSYHDYIIKNWHQRAAWRDKWSFAVCDERMRPGLWLLSVLCVFFGVLILMVRWQKGHMIHKTCSTNSQSFSFMDEEYQRATYLV